MILKLCQLGRRWRRYYSCEYFGDIRKEVTLYNDHLQIQLEKSADIGLDVGDYTCHEDEEENDDEYTYDHEEMDESTDINEHVSS